MKAFSAWDIAELVCRHSRKHLQPFLSPLHIQGLDVRSIISAVLPWELGALLPPGYAVGTMIQWLSDMCYLGVSEHFPHFASYWRGLI